MKAESNEIAALSNTTPNNEPLSSELLIRQALHGLLPLDSTFIRPKEGNDTCMLDLSGTADDHLKFLPGLNASRHAPKTPQQDNQSKIAIDPKTGAVVLVENGDARSTRRASQKLYQLDEADPTETADDGSNVFDGHTYADIMEMENKGFKSNLSNDEMDWE